MIHWTLLTRFIFVVMRSKKRIAVIVAAILVGVPALVISGFLAVLMLNERRVEAEAENCKALIPTLQEFRHLTGRFPSGIEAAQMDPKLVTDCGYSSEGRQFSMGLIGEGVNMQVYGYSSETNRWFWD
jgi:hypothetical protein